MTNPETITYEIDKALERERRFALLVDHLDQIDGCAGPDGSVPGVSRPKVVNGITRAHPRYALATLHGKGRTVVHLADTLKQLGDLAADRVTYGEEIEGYYDLDQLDGDDALALPEDVEYQGNEWMVHGFEYSDGKATGKWLLKKDPDDKRRSTYDWTTVDPSDCDLLGWEDDRLPVRYSVARVFIAVAFNTTPDQKD